MEEFSCHINIYYASMTLNEDQMSYFMTEKLILRVVFALEKFCSYLLGMRVTVYSNHTRYLMANRKLNCG